MKTTITVSCAHCGKQFDRYASEAKRSAKLGRKNYCSRECCGKDNNDHLIPSADHLNPRNRIDDFSPFRYLYKTAKMHCKQKDRPFDELTLQDLKNQWEKQEGLCPYTGWKLDLPATSGLAQKANKHPAKASLDRIDSSRGYTPDNIQFVSYMANCAKNEFSEESLVEFCKAVATMKR